MVKIIKASEIGARLDSGVYTGGVMIDGTQDAYTFYQEIAVALTVSPSEM